ncbi:hypothetical protein PABG_11897 [Paracoccidioides brasiliensis Pb03]|nr:hypothetical protein PABG_11897 [Paracoccidioides brasiliensis Pb03]
MFKHPVFIIAVERESADMTELLADHRGKAKKIISADRVSELTWDCDDGLFSNNSLELLTSSLQSRRASSPKDMRDAVAGGFKPSIVQLSQLTRHRDSRQLRS